MRLPDRRQFPPDRAAETLPPVQAWEGQAAGELASRNVCAQPDTAASTSAIGIAMTGRRVADTP